MKKTKHTAYKYDNNKPRWDLLPLECIEGIVKVLTYGAKKYEAHSWKSKVPDACNRYFAALMRHLVAYQNGEKLDTESGMSHLWHAGCDIMFLTWFDLQTSNYEGKTKCNK